MHIKKNFSENIIKVAMGVPEKTKDNIKASMDMVILCNRQELQLTNRVFIGQLKSQKAKVALLLDQRRSVCKWLREVHVLDGYCPNVGSCVDPFNAKFQNIKNYDHHIYLRFFLR